MQRKQPLWSVSLGHFTIDTFNGMVPFLVTFLSAHVMPLSNTQIGLAVSGYNLVGALSQPFFGWLADRIGGRWLGAGGAAWTISLLTLSLIIAQTTQTFVLMLIPLVVASLGSGAFHPVGAMIAADADSKQAGRNTAFFFLSGQLGLAVGPALGGMLLDRAATHFSLFTQPLGVPFQGALIEAGTVAPIVAMTIFAVPGIAFMIIALPGVRQHLAARAAHAAKAVQAAVAETTFPVRAFSLLLVVVALRSLINPGVVAFIPRLFQEMGWKASAYGLITSLYWVGGGISGVVVGALADRYDSRWLVALTLIASAPALFLLPVLDGAPAYAAALATGALSGSSHSLLIVQAQRLFPKRRGFASGAIVGFMFATGALGSLLIGALGDRSSLGAAFQLVAAVTVVTGVLGLLLPPDRMIAARAAGEVQAAAAAD